MKGEVNIKYKIMLSRPVHENLTQNLYYWSKERERRTGVVHCIWTKSQVSLYEYTMDQGHENFIQFSQDMSQRQVQLCDCVQLLITLPAFGFSV